MAVWETKLLEHSPESRCPFYVLYKISLAQAIFSLTQLKMQWRALASGIVLVSLTEMVAILPPPLFAKTEKHSKCAISDCVL